MIANTLRRPTDSAREYESFIQAKSHLGQNAGFDPLWMPDFLFDFQKALVDWSLRKGRAAIFADCGLGKTPMQLTWAENVVRKTNRAVLVLTPLAVGAQTAQEADKFGIECVRSRDGLVAQSKIVITNYEKLHLFKPDDFAGVVCDESSILKNFSGETRKHVTRFMLKIPYRSLWTATAAPNDYVELGTSSEALGELGYTDMLSRFFTASENAAFHRMERMKREGRVFGDAYAEEKKGNHFAKLAFRVSQTINQWVLKGHAQDHFWRWVCSWARACRKPSDLGFKDGAFVLPPLVERQHIVQPRRPADGMLFTLPAFGLNAERDERRRTLTERCEHVARLVNHSNPAVVWVHLNTEGDRLETMLPDALQVKGADSDEQKEEAYAAFQNGESRVLIIKPKIGAYGMNWQHCAHVVTFASHSYEQFYQSVRRCWRFGQTRPVVVDVVATTGEEHVRDNMLRKAAAAAEMFDRLVEHMNGATLISKNTFDNPIQIASWLPR